MVGTLQFADDRWLITAKPHVAMRVRRLFPQAQNCGRAIALTHTDEIARDFEWLQLRYPLEIDEQTAARLAGRAQASRDLEARIDDIMTAPVVQHGREPARPPRDYQARAADLACATGSLLVLHDVGLGKTYTSLLTLRDGGLPALVVTLGGRLPEQWLDQLGLIFPDLLGYVLPTGKLRDPADVLGRDPDVLITPYSRLQKYQDVLAGKIRTVIFDEVQELRHNGTERYWAAQKIAEPADRVLGLTATPIYNYGGELFNLIQVLRPGAVGERGEFMREYAASQYGSVAGNLLVRELGALGERLIEIGLMDRQTRRSVGRELPEPERVEQLIDIDQQPLDDANNTIRDLAQRYVDAERGLERMQAGTELDRMMRQATGLAKAAHVADFVRLLLESESKIVLFGWHHAVYAVWQRRLHSYGVAMYTGQQSVPQKREALISFTQGHNRVLIMSLRAGAGIDGLQDVASVVVFGELDWSPGVHTQNIGRLARDLTDGRLKPEPVIAYFCIADAGSDPAMVDVLGIKQRQSDELTDPDANEVEPVIGSDRVQRLVRAALAKDAS